MMADQSRLIDKMNIFTKVVYPDLLGVMNFAVKANIGCGHEASSSTPSLRDWVPEKVSPVVKSLVDKGHQLVAITNMHELAAGITSENPAFGDVDNPRKPGYIAGGSSGGSAAAVAMNAVTFALGTDTSSSVRLPASLCGVVGYRPSTGLYDTYAVCPRSTTTDTIGIFAQQVNIIQRVRKDIIPTYQPNSRSLVGLRFGVPRRYYYGMLDDEVARVTEAALCSLSSSGAELVEVDFSPGFEDDMCELFVDLLSYESHKYIPKFLKEQGAPVSYEKLLNEVSDPEIKAKFVAASKITDERYSQCLDFVRNMSKMFEKYFEENSLDAFVSPTTILPAVKRPSPKTVHISGQTMPTYKAYIHNCIPQASAGVPSISIPSGLTRDGLPVGLELVAPRGEDGSLLDIALAVQATLPAMPNLCYSDFL